MTASRWPTVLAPALAQAQAKPTAQALVEAPAFVEVSAPGKAWAPQPVL